MMNIATRLLGRRPPRTAAEWLAKSLSDDMSDSDYTALEQWLEVPENAKEFAIAQELWARAPEFARAPRAASPARHRGAWGFAASGIAAAAAASLVWFALVGIPETSVLVAERGDRSQTTLSDDSEILLNADSRVRVSFDRRERRIALQDGEAYFDVASDADRPFIVRAGDVRVTAVGTQFNVRAREPRVVVVDVLEGAVRVTAGDWTGVAEAGQQVRVSAGGVRLGAANVARVEGWRAGQIVLQSTPLAEVIEELSHFSEAPLVVADTHIGRRLVSGRFEGANVEDALAALEVAVNVRVERGQDGVLRVLDAPPE